MEKYNLTKEEMNNAFNQLSAENKAVLTQALDKVQREKDEAAMRAFLDKAVNYVGFLKTLCEFGPHYCGNMGVGIAYRASHLCEEVFGGYSALGYCPVFKGTAYEKDKQKYEALVEYLNSDTTEGSIPRYYRDILRQDISREYGLVQEWKRI